MRSFKAIMNRLGRRHSAAVSYNFGGKNSSMKKEIKGTISIEPVGLPKDQGVTLKIKVDFLNQKVSQQVLDRMFNRSNSSESEVFVLPGCTLTLNGIYTKADITK